MERLKLDRTARWHRAAYTQDCARIYGEDSGSPVPPGQQDQGRSSIQGLAGISIDRSWERRGRLYEEHALMADNAADRPIDCLYQYESGLS